MRYVLNIGLHANGMDGMIDPAAVISELRREDLPFTGAQVLKPGATPLLAGLQEPTLVVDLWTERSGVAVSASIMRVAKAFAQEAIAVFRWPGAGHNAAGVLIGPAAQRWGRFDPAQFYLLTGEQLCTIGFEEVL